LVLPPTRATGWAVSANPYGFCSKEGMGIISTTVLA